MRATEGAGWSIYSGTYGDNHMMRSRGERYAMALVMSGILVVWSGVAFAAIVQLIVHH